MKIYVNGSLAYDRLMNFKGRFSEQILPDQLHNINISFTMDSMQEFFGGTAGNIAYGLSLLKEEPILLGNLGKDGDRYLEYLRVLNVDVSNVSVLSEEFTAGAYITTDLDNNQITSFNAGAMKFPCMWQVEDIDPENSLVIIAPGNLHDMQMLPEILREMRVPFIFDPGQSLPAWQGSNLGKALDGAMMLLCNTYELELMCRLIKVSQAELLKKVRSMVVTNGSKGSTLYADGQVWRIGVVPVHSVVDPTGAGDAYRAGLLQSLARGNSLTDACRQGAALAAIAIQTHGTQGYKIPVGGLNLTAIEVKQG